MGYEGRKVEIVHESEFSKRDEVRAGALGEAFRVVDGSRREDKRRVGTGRRLCPGEEKHVFRHT